MDDPKTFTAAIAGGFTGISIVLVLIEDWTYIIPAVGLALFFWLVTYGNIVAERVEKKKQEALKESAEGKR